MNRLPAVLDDIISALLQDRELAAEHTSRGGRTTCYGRLQPLGLVVYRRALYLVARDPAAGRTLRLAVDRIESATRLQAHFRFPAGFDLAAELDRGFGIFQEGEPEEVLLRFAPAVADLVRARVWHSTQELSDRPDGGVLLRMWTCGRELVRLALEWGDKVEVLAPPRLRQAVAEELRDAAAQYASPTPAAAPAPAQTGQEAPGR